MTRSARVDCPPEVLRSIPWYAEEALSEAGRARLESHAAECASCRLELDQVAGRAPADASELPDPDAMYARILGRIDALELGSGARSAPPRRARLARVWIAPLAAAASVLLALGAGLWLGARTGPGAIAPDPAQIYTLASQPGAAAAAALPALDVVFRTDATAERITAALRGIGAEIVAGPTRLGVYRVHLASSGDASAAAEMLRAEGSGVATFAEPIRP